MDFDRYFGQFKNKFVCTKMTKKKYTGCNLSFERKQLFLCDDALYKQKKMSFQFIQEFV